MKKLLLLLFLLACSFAFAQAPTKPFTFGKGTPVSSSKINQNFDLLYDWSAVASGAIDNKADSGHLHDDRYYTETESDGLFSSISHLHDDRYYSESEINSQALTYSQAAMTSFRNSIFSADSRDDSYVPQDRNKGFYVDFKRNGVDGLTDGGNYHGNITFRPYGSGTDMSGGYPYQLGFTENTNIWLRKGATGSAWGSWYKLWHSGNDGEGSGLTADALDGYHASTTYNSPNTIPVRNSSGYLYLGWINTSSGSAGTTAPDRIYASYDTFLRYYTPANFAAVMDSYLLRKNANQATTGYLQAEGFAGTGSGGSLVLPGGANFATQQSSVVGAIRITLPETGTNTMLRFTVRVYEYALSESFDVYCGGYYYTNGNSWIRTFAYSLAEKRNYNYNVRFAVEGTKHVVYIGETTSAWSYPQVAVTDVVLGYQGYTPSYFDDGWNIDFTTSFGTVTSTHTNTNLLHKTSRQPVSFYVPGIYSANETLARFTSPRTCYLVSGAADCEATLETAHSSAITFGIYKNTTSVGTINFAAGSTTATFTLSSTQTLSAGDTLVIKAPTSATNAAGLTLSLMLTHDL